MKRIAPEASQRKGQQHQDNKLQEQGKFLSSPKRIDPGQYDKIRVVGKGAFGTATVCRKRRDCSLVVLKEIDLKKLPTQRERMFAINEANIMSMIDHINIIRYYNTYHCDSKLIIEMEYANNGTLSDYLSIQSQLLEEQEILIIFKQITIGLDYLHGNNIIHQDLKTANIFLSADGIVKIGDFGVARLLPSTSSSKQINRRNEPETTTSTQEPPQGEDEKRYTNTSHVRHTLNANYSGARISSAPVNRVYASYAGTPAYCSPEKCLGEPIDKKSDIWSLGCILYELATLRQTFDGSNLPAMISKITKVQYNPIKRNLSAGLRTILEQMLTKDPIRRPQASEIVSFTGKLLYKIQLDRYRINNLRSNYRLDLSTVVAALAANDRVEVDQIRCPHSLVYQVRLDEEHVTVNRLNLPKTKRFKEIAKGSNHYLALTYDNIVYGWGDRTKGQLGTYALPTVKRQSAAGSASKDSMSGSRLTQHQKPDEPTTTTTTTTTATATTMEAPPQVVMDGQRQSLMSYNPNSTNPLRKASPAVRPFILNELSGRKITQISAGNEFSIFLSKTGLVLTCGLGATGCLGHGNYDNCYAPMLVKSLLSTDVVSISCGLEHVVAVCGDGGALAWGNNENGRLGIGPLAGRPHYVNAPQPVIMPEGVFIKRAICGDQSTMFIDSDSQCWACGKNTYNKLGLDVRKRFKETHIVEEEQVPTRLTSLSSKQRPISCSIGQNHSGFLLDDGKLLIIGKDIDLTYETYEKHKKGDYLYPRTTGSVLAASLNPASHTGRQGLKTTRAKTNSLSRSTLVNLAGGLGGEKSLSVCEAHSDKLLAEASRQNATGKQRRTFKEYVKISRSVKKMLNNSVVKVACTSKLTLALTSDNRVYFWGTRSHHYQSASQAAYSRRLLVHQSQQQQPQLQSTCSSSIEPSGDISSIRRQIGCKTVTRKQIETQLVASCADDCLIKIGATNDSLMATIQKIGSDHPIIHVQDPKLIADSFQDLWILDYDCDDDDDGDTDQYDNQEKRLSSGTRDDDLSNSFISLDYLKHKKRHDIILKPQPIVGLYVPSLFKQDGHTICMSDMFCFDDDRFFIIFDTTVLPQQFPQSPRSSSRYGHPSNIQQQHKERLVMHLPKTVDTHLQDRVDSCGGAQKNASTKLKSGMNQTRQVVAITNVPHHDMKVKSDPNIVSRSLARSSTSSSSSSASPSSSTTTMLLHNKNIKKAHCSEKEFPKNKISVLKRSASESCPSSNQQAGHIVRNTNTNCVVEYQQASFVMDRDDDVHDSTTIKTNKEYDGADDVYPGSLSGISKTATTSISTLTNGTNSTLNSDLSVTSVNTTDNTIVSTDDHQFQSLAYEEPFSLSNIAHMTSTRYEFIKSASSSDLASQQALDHRTYDGNILSNVGGSGPIISQCTASADYTRPIVLSGKHRLAATQSAGLLLSGASLQGTGLPRQWGNSDHYCQDIGARTGNHVQLGRRRPRCRTTTNASIINIEEASNNNLLEEDETFYDGEEIADEDSVPDWVRKELEQVQGNFVSSKSLAHSFVGTQGLADRNLIADHQQHHNHSDTLDMLMEHNGSGNYNGNDSIVVENGTVKKEQITGKDLMEIISVSSNNSTLVEMGQQQKPKQNKEAPAARLDHHHQVDRSSACDTIHFGDGSDDLSPLMVEAPVASGQVGIDDQPAANFIEFAPTRGEASSSTTMNQWAGWNRQSKRCSSMPCLFVDSNIHVGSHNPTVLSIRKLQQENRSLSRELMEARCTLNKYRQTIDSMSQEISQHKAQSGASNCLPDRHERQQSNLSHSTRHLLDDDVGEERSPNGANRRRQRCESLLSFRRSMIKLFC